MSADITTGTYSGKNTGYPRVLLLLLQMPDSGSKPEETVFCPHYCPSGNDENLRMDEHSSEVIADEDNEENTLLSSVIENLI